MSKCLVLLLCLTGSYITCWSQKVFSPTSNSSITGGATYCQNAAATQLSYTYNTCNTGSGVSSGSSITISWYSNITNSTSGGTLVSSVTGNCAIAATGNTTYVPITTVTGTLYYYSQITWSGSGTCNVSGTLTSGITSVMVTTIPGTITGATTGCVGTTLTLSNSVPGGTWASSANPTATISTGGIVSAVATGTATISYSIGTCRSTTSFSVIANPPSITGSTTNVCEGATISYSNTTTGGTWTTGNSAIATIDMSSPVNISGITAGTTNITYTAPTGCYITKAVTVNIQPAAITGIAVACVGYQSTLYNSIPGGVWSSTATVRATIDASTGVAGSVAFGGTALMYYTIGTCSSTVLFTINTNPLNIAGTNTVCQNAITTLTDASTPGTWSISNASIATINNSVSVGVTGITAGTTTITFTSANNCYITRPVIVNVAPGPITGPTSVCLGSSTSLGNSVAGGIWLSSVPSRASIDSNSGIVSTLTTGASTISYSVGNCKAGVVLTVAAVPAVIGATQTSVCEGSTITFTNTVNGGTWSSSNTSVATISATGIIRGVTAGTATITYMLGSCYVTRTATVNIQPGPITGTVSSCHSSSVTLSNAVPSGVWSSASPTKATISASGVVTTVANGTSVISYTIASCASGMTFTTLVVPTIITGASSVVCQNATRAYLDTAVGGTWTSANTAIASVNASTGLVSGVTPGTTTITYSTGCGANTTRPITVNIAPAAIAGSTAFCAGVISSLTNSVSGGVWSSGTTAVGTINSSTGAISPLSAGTSLISYIIGGTCGANRTITVSTQPAAISGLSVLCNPGSITLSNSVTGGTWTSSNTALATVNSLTGIVTAVGTGSADITYSTGCGTPVIKTINVFTTPAAISGSNTVCTGTITSLTNATPSGTWTSSNLTAATINSSTGAMTAVSAGNITITYTVGAACTATYPVTINTQPGVINSVSFLCSGVPATLSNAVAGGSWTSSAPGIITINSSTGLATGLSAGTSNITYANASCIAATTLTNTAQPATPSAITGIFSLCQGLQTTLASLTTGSVWSSSNSSIATIHSLTGLILAGSPGTANISYTTSNICGSASTVHTFTVSANPTASIVTPPVICLGTTGIIVFNGTPGATVTFNIDGGSNIMHILPGGSYSLSTGLVVANHIYNLVEVHDASCSTTINTVANANVISMQWVGGASGHETSWDYAGNWSCGFVPDSVTDVTIASGTLYPPTIPAGGSAFARNLILDSGTTITANTGSKLNVKGTLSNNGQFTGAGTLQLKGPAFQNIYGIGTISNLELINVWGASISAASSITIKNSFTIISGTFNTNDSLLLASDSSGTARIGYLPMGSSITGKMTIQQYIPGGYRRYRFVSHPFNSAISLSQVQKCIDITGIGGSFNGFTSTSTNASSVFRLDPYKSNSTLGYDPGWKPFTKINISAADTNKFQRYQGLRLFVRGAKGQGLGYTFLYNPSPVTIAITGTINQGAQLVTLARGVDPGL
ncbi:beta strand repeat-containing protein [Flavipsychrobacter stenotrophus]|nr:Ig-like domain-containing protein [Flavipsychrobacter stenotrophus]